MSREYSSRYAELLTSYMDANGYKYDFDQDKGSIRLVFAMKGKINKIHLRYNITKWGFVAYGIIDIAAGEERRQDVAEFITRANYGMMRGNFEMDFNDGEIRYKFAADSDGGEFSDRVIENSMNYAMVMFEQYGDALLRVIFGMESAEEAVRAAEGNG